MGWCCGFKPHRCRLLCYAISGGRIEPVRILQRVAVLPLRGASDDKQRSKKRQCARENTHEHYIAYPKMGVVGCRSADDIGKLIPPYALRARAGRG